MVLFWFFVFKQKTAYEMRISDWSSDVCSSDLLFPQFRGGVLFHKNPAQHFEQVGRSGNPGARDHHGTVAAIVSAADAHQCEEIGSGKEAHHQDRKSVV